MNTTVTIDRQGRIVVPPAERRRLGLEEGEELALVPTPRGSSWSDARVRTGPDGLPLVAFTDHRPVPGDEALAALRAHRDER